MKAFLKTNINESEELFIDDFNICKDILLKELKEEYPDTNILKEKIISLYLTLYPTSGRYALERNEDENLEQLFHSFICSLEMHGTGIFRQSVFDACKKYDFYLPKILKIFSMQSLGKTPFNSFLLMDRKTTHWIIEEFNKGFKEQWLPISKHKTIIDVLAKNNKNELSPLYTFFDDLNKTINDDITYMLFEDSDEYLDYARTYIKTLNINYTKIISSKEFIKYINESNFENDAYDDMEELISEFISDSQHIDIKEEIIRYIMNHSEQCKLNTLSKEEVVNLTSGVPTLVTLMKKEFNDPIFDNFKTF